MADYDGPEQNPYTELEQAASPRRPAQTLGSWELSGQKKDFYMGRLLAILAIVKNPYTELRQGTSPRRCAGRAGISKPLH